MVTALVGQLLFPLFRRQERCSGSGHAEPVVVVYGTHLLDDASALDARMPANN